MSMHPDHVKIVQDDLSALLGIVQDAEKHAQVLIGAVQWFSGPTQVPPVVELRMAADRLGQAALMIRAAVGKVG